MNTPQDDFETDPYGFVDWLNATRSGEGLEPVAYDAELSAWAARNNDEQARRGLGHYVTGPARRQNAGRGPFAAMGPLWMASPPHRDALLDPTIRRAGIAGSGGFWTFNSA